MGLFDFFKDKDEKNEKQETVATSSKAAQTTAANVKVEAEKKVATSTFPKTGVVNATNLNIRTGASLERDIITTVPNGVRLTLLDELNGWFKVQLSDGKIGWASGEYIN